MLIRQRKQTGTTYHYVYRLNKKRRGLLFVIPLETTSRLLTHAKEANNPTTKASTGASSNDIGTLYESQENIASQFGVRQTSNQKNKKIKNRGLNIPKSHTLAKYISKYRISSNMSSENIKTIW